MNDTRLSAPFAGYGTAFGGLPQQSQVLTEQISRFNQECMDFMQRRLLHNFNAMQALARCSSAPDLLQVQLAWFGEAVDDYTAEMHRITEIYGAAAVTGTARPSEGRKPLAPSQ